MAGPRPEKVAVVEEVREHLGTSSAAILTEYRGLKVGDLATLRRQLRVAGADYKIFKNTLVRRATADTDQAQLAAFLDGPTAIVFVRDDIGPVAKVLRDFGRVHPELVIKGGLLGNQLVDAGRAIALADLPSRDVLLAQLAGAMAAPMRQFAGLLQALPRSFAYGLSALVTKLGGVAEVVEPTEAAEPVEASAETEPEAAEPETAESVAEASEPVEASAETEPEAVESVAEASEPVEASAETEPEAVESVAEASAEVPEATAETPAPAEPPQPSEG
ncbi:MAG: 50S ribosomal protein L10 [Acidimicrobiales bacterium]|jgi:large subunit ribosomal protein L10